MLLFRRVIYCWESLSDYRIEVNNGFLAELGRPACLLMSIIISSKVSNQQSLVMRSFHPITQEAESSKSKFEASLAVLSSSDALLQILRQLKSLASQSSLSSLATCIISKVAFTLL